MAVPEDVALWLENAGEVHKAHHYRQLLSGLVGNRPGIFGIGDLKVIQRAAGANKSVDVEPGGCTIPNTADVTGANGNYFAFNDARLNVPIDEPDGSNARKDLIVVQVRDTETDGGLSDDGRIRVVTGAPSGSPVTPDVPDNSLVLAQLLIGAAASSVITADITDLRTLFGQSVIQPLGIPDQLFADALSGGTATSYAAFGTHNAIGVAPFPLTMVVEVMGWMGFAGANNADPELRIQDEAGSNITYGPTGPASIPMTGVASVARRPVVGRGIKTYAAGDTMGFRLAYQVATSSVFIQVSSRVSFIPKVNA